jgi:Ran GTPase-activating protein (RanGAP) involved in mRNA processing and transport
VESFVAKGNTLTKVSLQILIDISKDGSNLFSLFLRKLDLSYNPFTTCDIQMIHRLLLAYQNLEALELESCGLELDKLEGELSDFSATDLEYKLRHLNLSDNPIRPLGFESVMDLVMVKMNCSLEYLALRSIVLPSNKWVLTKGFRDLTK